jgi:hypothetical protein
VWFGRKAQGTSGSRTRVAFDGLWALRREEERRDVLGFLHTHPDGSLSPSRRDVRTMRAWASALGKPLLCVIAAAEGVSAWRFDDDRSDGVEVPEVQFFPRGVVIAVERAGTPGLPGPV